MSRTAACRTAGRSHPLLRVGSGARRRVKLRRLVARARGSARSRLLTAACAPPGAAIGSGTAIASVPIPATDRSARGTQAGPERPRRGSAHATGHGWPRPAPTAATRTAALPPSDSNRPTLASGMDEPGPCGKRRGRRPRRLVASAPPRHPGQSHIVPRMAARSGQRGALAGIVEQVRAPPTADGTPAGTSTRPAAVQHQEKGAGRVTTGGYGGHCPVADAEASLRWRARTARPRWQHRALPSSPGRQHTDTGCQLGPARRSARHPVTDHQQRGLACQASVRSEV